MKKWNIGWGTVAACNMKCQFCYSKERRKQGQPLGLTEWKKFIDQNYEKINTINYGTGENSINDDWFKLVYYVREKYPDIRQALTTNGFFSERIKNQELYEMATKAIDEFDISLDFCVAEKHAELRGQKDAFNWALNTLKYCNENNKDATIVFLGSKINLNKENIKGLFKIAKDYNAKLRMNLYRPTEGIDEISKRFIPTYENLIGILEFISKNYEVLTLNDALFSPLLTGKASVDPSGVDSLRILANGDITPSTYLIHEEYIVGNIQDNSVLNNIEEKILDIITNVIPRECEACTLKEKCKGGVIDRRYLWYHTLEKRDPYCRGPYKDMDDLTEKISLSEKEFHSVHDGYLPTMFFINK